MPKTKRDRTEYNRDVHISDEEIFERLKDDPVILFFKRNRGRAITASILILILVFAFFIRRNTFWLPHWLGDQCHYLCLSAKLQDSGLSDYNLRGIDVRFVDILGNSKIRLVYPYVLDDPNQRGIMLERLEYAGIKYYEMPLFQSPPGFPYLLMLSHTIFAGRDKPYTVVFTSIAEHLDKIKPRVFLNAQFYATVIPFSFSLLLIAATFMLGREFFSGRVGLYAAFLLAIHPVDIMTSQKIWADEGTAFFMIISLLVFTIAFRKDSAITFFISGLLCGISFLLKQTGALLLMAVWAFTIFSYNIPSLIHLPKKIFNRNFLLFGCGMLLVSGFWFLKVHQTYGTPFYVAVATQDNIVASDIAGWFRMLSKRPPGIILFPVGMIFLCPLFALSLLTFKEAILEIRDMLNKKPFRIGLAISWMTVIVFYLYLRINREHRYVLPVYPIMAVLSAYYLDKLFAETGILGRYIKTPIMRTTLICCLLLLTAAWSIPLGVRTILTGNLLLKIPF